MVNFILTILAIALTAAVLYTMVSYVNPNQAIARGVGEQVYAGFTTLEQALNDHKTATGDWLAPGLTWASTLTPAYAFLPRPPKNMAWNYALGGAGRYLCLAPINGSALVSEAQYKGFTRFAEKVSAQQGFVSTAGCGVVLNSQPPSSWPASVFVTYWIEPY
jgi:hypothetical protein